MYVPEFVYILAISVRWQFYVMNDIKDNFSFFSCKVQHCVYR